MIDANTESAIRTQLATLSGSPIIVWPNEVHKGNAPYLEVSFSRTPPSRMTIAAHHRRRTLVQVVAVWAKGKATRGANEAAEAVAALFPADLALSGADGERIRVVAAPHISGGFDDKKHWRVPVTITLETMSS